MGFYSQKTDISVDYNKKNIFHNKNINLIASKLSEAIKTALETYWELDCKASLLAVNDFRNIRDEFLVNNIDFFSGQIKVENHKPITIRLCKNFIENFLNITLNNKKTQFNLKNLTALEIKILNSFCEFTYKKIKPCLISTKDSKLSEKSEKNINFIFCITSENMKVSYMVVSIPQDRIALEELKKSTSFDDIDFINSQATVKIRAGRSKITLEELKNLTNEDIILLEDSKYDRLTLISGNLEKDFKIKVNSDMIISFNQEETKDINYEKNNEVTMEKNLWDDIQVEINAEFDKVKMTIGELKQITQGQIVDLGSIFENEISLYVEEKKVAKGDLIIINDRYAVRLNEILSNPKTKIEQPKPQPQQAKPQAQPQQAKPQPQPQQAKPQPQPQQAKPQTKAQVVDEEFDYSDFEK